MLRSRLAGQQVALSVGLGLTALAALAAGLGWIDRLEWQGYDFQVRYFSRVPASERILHVDIDDRAFDRVVSWPWPRDLQADLVRILGELGAAQVIPDLVWSEPRAQRELRSPSNDLYAGLEGEIPQVGELTEENLVYPDDELAAAVSETAGVYLAMYYQQQVGAEFEAPATAALETVRLLESDFSLDAEQLASRMNRPIAEAQATLAGAKRTAAQRLVAGILATRPAADARAVCESVLATPFERLTADRADLMAAYYREMGLQRLREQCPAVPDSLRGRIPEVTGVLPPLYTLLARPGQRVGFVNFREDPDGTVRHLPLMVEWNGRLIEQLAFAAARDALGIGVEDLAVEGGDLRIAAGGQRPAIRVPLDDDGQMLINWHARGQSWTGCFEHLPVTQVLRIADARKSLHQNAVWRHVRQAEVVRAVKDAAAYAAYAAQMRKMNERARAARLGRLRGQASSPAVADAQAEADELAGLLRREFTDSAALVRDTWQQLSTESRPADEDAAREYDRLAQAAAVLDEELPQLDRLILDIEAQEAEIIGQLRPKVQGRICIVGYTATAVADMVNAPAYGRLPGVMIHSQALNSFLTGRFRDWSPRWLQVLVVALFGSAVTLVTAGFGPRGSLVLVGGAIAASLLVSAAVLFGMLSYWLPLLWALVSGFVIWAMIVLVRYLVTDRQRRRLSKAVSQYVSPAMAREISKAPGRLDMAPAEAVVTCFFSDLAGFTTISEQLGPEDTRAVLNPYLEAMTHALHGRSALINKFMGDGVFAFFNPPILPCPDHRRAACEAALDARAALAELIAAKAGSRLAEGFARLAMRIGIASGTAFVGDYGSESKLDYTCVGDVVNLAARLESANKQFGTGIMVSGPTRDAAGHELVFRPLGVIQVKGQHVGTRVYELLGRQGELDGASLAGVEAFERGLAAFSARQWDIAAAEFEACLQACPADRAPRRYLEAIHLYVTQAPPEGWAGALELTEK